jgi:hypothetical protein
MPGELAPDWDRSTYLSRLECERIVTGRLDDLLLTIDRTGPGQLETLLLVYYQ